jgi:hypothetical protein
MSTGTSRAEPLTDLVAERDPRLGGEHDGRDPPAVEPLQGRLQGRCGVVVHRAGREAVGDHEGHVVLVALEACGG